MKQLFPADPNVPKAIELISQAEVYLIESDPLNDYPRPTVPNVKLIGGICASPAKELNNRLSRSSSDQKKLELVSLCCPLVAWF